jgi:hypothetical protein
MISAIRAIAERMALLRISASASSIRFGLGSAHIWFNPVSLLGLASLAQQAAIIFLQMAAQSITVGFLSLSSPMDDFTLRRFIHTLDVKSPIYLGKTGICFVHQQHNWAASE